MESAQTPDKEETVYLELPTSVWERLEDEAKERGVLIDTLVGEIAKAWASGN